MAETTTEHSKQAQPSSHAHCNRIICIPSKSSHESFYVECTQPRGTDALPEGSHQKKALSSPPRALPDGIVPTATIEGSSALDYPSLILCGDIDDVIDEQLLESPLAADSPTERPSRVRFRSRVRITSGLKRHRYQSQDEHDYVAFTASSSRSGSPSSSISAPLRSQAEDDIGKPGWGTLGQRVSLFAQGSAQRNRRRTLLARYGTMDPHIYNGLNGIQTNERTPLIHSTLPSQMQPSVSDTASASELEREIDLVFGPWPDRLWNHHWWWWHIEPIVCCRCLNDSDDEGS